MIVILTLGGVIFQDFEIPDSIKGGIEQKLDIKKFIGGSRTVDVLGRDDADIEWSGRFRGSTGEQRCQQLNAMAASGDPVQLTWSSFSYQVIVNRFTFEYQSPLEILYRICLTVETDNTIPISSILQTIDEVFGTDLATALNLGDTADIAVVTESLNQIQTAASTIQTLSGSTSPALAQLQATIVSAQGITGTAISAAAGQIPPAASNVFGTTAGLPPQTIVSNLAGQASAFGQLSSLIPLGSVLSLMGKNVATASP